MFAHVNAFFDLLSAALTAGAMFGLWLGMDPPRLPASIYVAQQQALIRGMNVAMPLLGATTILLTLVNAFEARNDQLVFMLFLTSAGCFLVAGLVTRFRNQPINAVVSTWSTDAPPPGWEQLRDRWWRWHVLRTASGVTGLCVLIAATLNPPVGG
jgi:hypothetical protein